ncbi:arsenate reductase (glutaredoxin) [Antarcticibacterium flavum]|uniref:Arsenate reductase (Glutaredoxin) n=1 Tax=Antarcticibacterium flavum TaxID=2058175 RepID=A0A5B7WZ39_9FLAO|nr:MULTISPECIES: arsenate reductase (glutaredoxin) [Antarcticibacterium]MCM4159007.1 arsenate reductase (glutaredoxin) [Antarcticibacterium sp. W02-3]QCY68257.1 arsenate reductase (glutaredoxin) [Antarcticibacterium flavum]
MITIYHNPRCRKSREGLEILEKSGQKFETREYLKEPLTEAELDTLISKLQIAPVQLVRRNESIWKENYKDRDLSDRELVAIMAENPKLIERPIVEKNDKAVIGRPPSNIEKIL